MAQLHGATEVDGGVLQVPLLSIHEAKRRMHVGVVRVGSLCTSERRKRKVPLASVKQPLRVVEHRVCRLQRRRRRDSDSDDAAQCQREQQPWRTRSHVKTARLARPPRLQ
jgi:hypothetical protein